MELELELCPAGFEGREEQERGRRGGGREGRNREGGREREKCVSNLLNIAAHCILVYHTSKIVPMLYTIPYGQKFSRNPIKCVK